MSLSLTPIISNNLTQRGQHETIHLMDALRTNHGWLSRLLDVMKKLFNWVLSALLMLAFCVFMAVIVIEWMAGCGEYYIDAKGVRHLNECIFINFPPKE
jgi:lipopolysaccharide/colanic/teichoic acid biosynthesis glycosyltransferase